jgi:ATP-dependent 26S proteasome regulatory subunit
MINGKKNNEENKEDDKEKKIKDGKKVWYEITKNTNIEILTEKKEENKKIYIGGLEKEFEILNKIIPFENLEIYKKYNISPVKGILIFGISGVGKTLLGKIFTLKL